MNYSDKLHDPRWQKKRLEILQRENFKCQCCGDVEEELHIHHLIYHKGEPWDIPSDHLECLCKLCHDEREDFNALWGGRSLTPTAVCLEFRDYFESAFTENDKWLGKIKSLEHLVSLCHKHLVKCAKEEFQSDKSNPQKVAQVISNPTDHASAPPLQNEAAPSRTSKASVPLASPPNVDLGNVAAMPHNPKLPVGELSQTVS